MRSRPPLKEFWFFEIFASTFDLKKKSIIFYTMDASIPLSPTRKHSSAKKISAIIKTVNNWTNFHGNANKFG